MERRSCCDLERELLGEEDLLRLGEDLLRLGEGATDIWREAADTWSINMV